MQVSILFITLVILIDNANGQGYARSQYFGTAGGGGRYYPGYGDYSSSFGFYPSQAHGHNSYDYGGYNGYVTNGGNRYDTMNNGFNRFYGYGGYPQQYSGNAYSQYGQYPNVNNFSGVQRDIFQPNSPGFVGGIASPQQHDFGQVVHSNFDRESHLGINPPTSFSADIPVYAVPSVSEAAGSANMDGKNLPELSSSEVSPANDGVLKNADIGNSSSIPTEVTSSQPSTTVTDKTPEETSALPVNSTDGLAIGPADSDAASGVVDDVPGQPISASTADKGSPTPTSNSTRH